MGGNMGTVQNAIKSNDWGLKEQLTLAGWEALAQLSGSKYAYQKARGLSKLKAHMQNERYKQLQPYRGEKTFNIFILKRDKNWCYLCHKYIQYGDAEVEHDIPVSRFGKTDEYNCHSSHHWCNMRKGTKTAKEYLGR